MSFKDIKGQERAVEFFRNSVNRDRLAHAYLFSGPRGLGKSLLAGTLAKFLNCENPVKNGDLLIDCCDSCISCRKIDDFNHPDVHWIQAQKQSGKISIDEIRAMQKEVSLKAYEGRFKIFIIQDAQRITEQAANSLLKTLEEPPPLSLLILISTNMSGLLPTIISRCQIIKFYPLKCESLRKILIEDYGLDADNANFLSIASEGRLGEALRLREEDTLNKKNHIIDQVFRVTLERSGRVNRRTSCVEIFNIKDKKELAMQIKYLLNWFRDILIFKAGISTSNIINADRIERIRARSGAFSFQELEQIISKIDEAYRLIELNVNPKIALEVMLGGIEKCRR